MDEPTPDTRAAASGVGFEQAGRRRRGHIGAPPRRIRDGGARGTHTARRPMQKRTPAFATGLSFAASHAARGSPCPASPANAVVRYSVCDAQSHVPSAEASGATCVQRLDDSQDSAIHTNYRISLRSSSEREPRYPLPTVLHRNRMRRRSNHRSDSGGSLAPFAPAFFRNPKATAAPPQREGLAARHTPWALHATARAPTTAAPPLPSTPLRRLTATSGRGRPFPSMHTHPRAPPSCPPFSTQSQ
eukprot:TRINITY_DN5117_c0_g2_i1.p1 TRINITY_DN5117_c0_g2~~TRINITY_DN5117_c0_g2_i1.p1  ORF type:complete len:245 (+),score=-48.62 TRINITY_DN5117_c0_g2_i1:3471-4205(+)